MRVKSGFEPNTVGVSQGKINYALRTARDAAAVGILFDLFLCLTPRLADIGQGVVT